MLIMEKSATSTEATTASILMATMKSITLTMTTLWDPTELSTLTSALPATSPMVLITLSMLVKAGGHLKVSI